MCNAIVCMDEGDQWLAGSAHSTDTITPKLLDYGPDERI